MIIFLSLLVNFIYMHFGVIVTDFEILKTVIVIRFFIIVKIVVYQIHWRIKRGSGEGGAHVPPLPLLKFSEIRVLGDVYTCT